MLHITSINGKGGTGKTTLVASFVALAENKVVANCDVDAPEIKRKAEFNGLKVAEVSVVEFSCGRVSDVIKNVWVRIQ